MGCLHNLSLKELRKLGILLDWEILERTALGRHEETSWLRKT